MIVPPGSSFPSRSAASTIARATRSFMEPVGFWFSSFTKSWHGPVSIRVISTSGVSPMRERIAGGFVPVTGGKVESSIMRKSGLMRPLGVAVRKKLLEHIETDFTVIQGVAQIAAFENPCGRNLSERQMEDEMDLV